MNSKLLLLLILVALSQQENTLPDDGVLEVTDEIFDDVLAKNPIMMLEFHAAWCNHCKKLAPEYAKAAKKLFSLNPTYLLAKIDSTENKKITDQFGVKGFPTMLFFKDGQSVEYKGERTEKDIVEWFLKKVGPSS